jgi:hypothetical protein
MVDGDGAAAPPPTALNSDTSCGIAVIFTVRRCRPARRDQEIRY